MMRNIGFAVIFSILSSGYCYKISLTSDGPVVVGATISFKAAIRDDNGQKPSGTFQFKWRDNAIPYHSRTVEGDFTASTWNVTYPKEKYSSGTYEVQVEISRRTFIFWNVGSKRLEFELTSLLNGGMTLAQSNATVQTDYVSSASEVTHYVNFTRPDAAYLERNASSVVAYWFVNCIYYGATSDLSFSFNYSNAADQERHVEALIVASHDLPPTPTTTVAPTTTSTTIAPTTVGPTTTSTTTPRPTTTTVPTTTVLPSNNITALVQPNLKLGTNASQIPILPYICVNTSIIPPDPRKTYGYFARKLEIKGPVTNVVFSPNNWLQHGDILNLTVSCNGSAPFVYCFKIFEGNYNVTGNETCSKHQSISECQISMQRYFHNSGTYTVLIIISNQVSKKITPVGVNIYEVKKHAQLSVIVVPVTCSAIAVILIVFGAAYYMQGRHRYTIEVADFDFAQASDMEYMTFSQRLKSAVNNAFTRTHESNYNRLNSGTSQERY